MSFIVLTLFFFTTSLIASKVPSQAGIRNLIWVHAKTQGIALKLLIFFDLFLLAGLDPINKNSRIFCGVTLK